MRLKNKVALITGATGGMGSAIAKLFVQEGAKVVVTARKDDKGRQLVNDIIEAGGQALFVELDVTSENEWTEAVQKTKDSFGALHILLNVAGVNTPSIIPFVDMNVWRNVFNINVTGPLLGIQACAPLMKESGGGSIVNIGSTAGMTSHFSTAYSTSKWALRGLSGSAAFCLADWGIRSNVIDPGMIDTDMTKNMPKEAIENAILLKRAGKVDEIAQAALFLASDESAYTTGTEILVDGGYFSTGMYLPSERKANLLENFRKKMEQKT
jgi:3alpha(or 20beta)-hydroxysteroid dehydrogenase